MKVQVWENIYEVACESEIMYGIEVCGLSEAWIEIDKTCSRFCKKLKGIPNCTASGFAEM